MHNMSNTEPDAALQPNADTEEPHATDMSEEQGSDPESELSAFLQAVKAPISEENPAGDSIAYDDDFQTLKSQINLIGSVSGEADYETIVELARRILTQKSKDLRAASYLVVGEARSNGAEGLAEATEVVALLISTYWEGLYPGKRRMRGRGNALQFISDRLGDWFETASFSPPDYVPLTKTRDNLEAIQDFVLQEMGEDAPKLSGLLKRVNKAIDKLPKPDEPEEESEPETSDDKAQNNEGERTEPSPTSQGAIPSEIGSESDVVSAIRTAADYFTRQDLANPIPYRLMRSVRWGSMRAAPPSEGSTTRIEAPLKKRREYLSGLLETKDYETLIREGESSFRWETFHLWLDLQRLIAASLDALGTPYKEARDAVMVAVALLKKRLPSLLSLSYSDGTPFASPLTQDWIETQVAPLLGGSEQAARGSSAATDEMPVLEQYNEARKRLSEGKLSEALAVMTDGAASDASGKESFFRRLYIASLCMKGGQPSVARPLLDELDGAIDRHAINEWDGALATEVWTNRCQCYDQLAQQAPPEDKESLFQEADAAFEKICRVNPAEAISVAERRSR